MASASNLIVQIQVDTTAWEDAIQRLHSNIHSMDRGGAACPYCGVVSEYRAAWPWCCGCGAPLAMVREAICER